MIYRLANSDKKPWSAPARSPRLAIETAQTIADHLNEPIVIWAQKGKGFRLKPCRRVWPLTHDHFVAGKWRRKSEKVR
jgi:hypothetical protein